MGERGPLPTPPHLKLHKGQGRRQQRHPQPVVAAPDKPPHLGEVASKLWDDVVPELERMRMLSKLDGVVLELFVTTYERWLAHDGDRGYPALTACVTKLARELGLSPAQRLRLPAPERDDVVADVFGGRLPRRPDTPFDV